MPRFLKLFLAILSPLLVCGCIHLEQEVKLNAAGSAIVKYHYAIADDVYDTVVVGRKSLVPAAAEDREMLNWFTDEDAVEKNFKDSGFQVQLYRAYRKDGRHHFEILLVAEDFHRALRSGKLGNISLQKNAAGNWVLSLVNPLEKTAKLDKRQLEKLQALCDDLVLKLVFEVPGEIVSTSAKEISKSGRGTSWTFDLANGDEFLRKFPEVQTTFSGKELKW